MDQQKEIINNVLNYIEDNIREEINVDKIAKNAGYSKFYLNRIFSEYTGMTLHKYVQSRRLTIAAEKLIKTNAPISQPAHEAGYDSQQAFSLAFKQLYVYPPKMYKTIRGVYTKAEQNLLVWESRFNTNTMFFSKFKEKAA